MIVEFEDEYLLDLYRGKPKGKPKYQATVVKQYRKTVRVFQMVNGIQELRSFRSLNFEALSGNLQGLFSVRVNKQYRVLFRIKDDQLQIEKVISITELSKHYE
ncbi:type II toxin-antitoxin system RelE/ParE family toxin [Catalinimonas sp. 4WD22]|uniref:type II toxin-antitoxin system RelE/ParE family toxin n=1 Tax=Catalinimonas locisalis TaxID=3133978 RepID=UPI0031018778